MLAWLGGLAGTLLDATLAATVLSSLGALLMVACQQPARRCLVARATLLGLLALIPLTALGFRPRWDLRGVLRGFAPPAGTIPAWLEWDDAASRAVALVAVGLYLAGLIVGLGWVGLGLWASRRLVRLSRGPSEPLQTRYEALGADFGCLPGLRVSDRIRGPLLVGLRRPTIVIPAGMEDQEGSEALRLGLLHELVHARRRDAGFTLLASLAGACWYFLPMLWWVRAQMRIDQEFLADREASDGYGPFGAYASTLVTMADFRTSPAGAGRPSRALQRTPLVLRVLMLVRCPFGMESSPPAWWRWTLAGVVGTATVLVSGLTLRSAEPTRPAPGPTPPAHGTFRLGRLLIDPTRTGTDGLPIPYTLMCPLPERFELAVQVWASPEELPQIRVAGYPLGPSARPDDAPTPAEDYHAVRIVRDGRTTRVWVDQSPVREVPGPPTAGGLLGFQPAPGKLGRFRDLVLSW